jgi:hypothetical protein
MFIINTAPRHKTPHSRTYRRLRIALGVRWQLTQGAAMLGGARAKRREGNPVTGVERDPQQRYEMRVRGHLGTKMLRAFPAFAARPRGGDTLLTGRLPDQAAVYGVIARLEALGLELLEFRRLPD